MVRMIQQQTSQQRRQTGGGAGLCAWRLLAV
jgi:hypothetical protein